MEDHLRVRPPASTMPVEVPPFMRAEGLGERLPAHGAAVDDHVVRPRAVVVPDEAGGRVFEALLCIARAHRHRRIAPGARSHCVKARRAPSLQSRPAAPCGGAFRLSSRGWRTRPPRLDFAAGASLCGLDPGPGLSRLGHPVKKGALPR